MAEALKVGFAQGKPGGHGVTAEGEDEVGMAFGNKVQRIAHVQSGDGAPRAFDKTAFGARKGNGGAVIALTQPPGNNADDALVPVGFKQADGAGCAGVEVLQAGFGGLLHGAFNIAPRAVVLFQRAGKVERGGSVIGEQTFNAQTHVVQPPGGVQARGGGKAQVKGGGALWRACGDGKERAQARLHPPCADAL